MEKNEHRFAVWKNAIAGFFDFPIFGNGFSGLRLDDSVLYPFGPLGKMAHNTLLELLYATGTVGLVCYVRYRIYTVGLVISRPAIHKSLAAASMAVLVFSSLLDNFIFNVYPTFFYSASLCVIIKSASESSAENGKKIKNKKTQKNT